MILSLWVLAFISVGLSYKNDVKKTNLALTKSFKSFLKLLPALVIMILIVEAIFFFFPRERLLVLFQHKGFFGLFVISFVGAILTIPGPVAFPLVGELLKMGVEEAQLAAFVTTLTMVGFATAPAESTYFGKRFVFIRQSLSLVAAIVVGLIMGEIL